MSLRGQKFELDVDADDFTPIPVADNVDPLSSPSLVGEIKERDSAALPAPPKLKASRTGFPEHRKRTNPSAFKQDRLQQNISKPSVQHAQADLPTQTVTPCTQPSDQEIAHRMGKKHGYDFESKEKAQISDENNRRIAAMSDADIEDARAELMANLNPALIEKLLRRANIDEQHPEESIPLQQRAQGDDKNDSVGSKKPSSTHKELPSETQLPDDASHPHSLHEPQAGPAIHFPIPPRSASSFVPLDPNSSSFLTDLKSHYFPDTSHDPASLSWLQDPTAQEDDESPYNPTRDNYSTSQLRFSFTGIIIPPAESLDIDVSKGLHHHGLAPSSAGYTIPELAMLSRSTLPNQRCIAYQIVGRILFRLGRGDLGPRGSELHEGLWSVIEKERVIEVMMSEANRDNGHVSAKAYATEALWLWRRGGGGERGLLKPSERHAT